MKRAAILLALVATCAQAQTYIGGSVGYGTNKDPQDKRPLTHIAVDMKRESPNAGAFIGHRSGWWGVEGGVFSLPRFHNEAYTWDYAAYKKSGGPHDLQTAQITTDIGGTAFYARGQVYGPTLGGFTPYAFAGMAYSFNRSYEFGYYDHTRFVENDQRFDNYGPIFGAGVQYQMCDRWAARVEYLKASRIVKNPHTGTRDVDMLSVGLVYQWGAR